MYIGVSNWRNGRAAGRVFYRELRKEKLLILEISGNYMVRWEIISESYGYFLFLNNLKSSRCSFNIA